MGQSTLPPPRSFSIASGLPGYNSRPQHQPAETTEAKGPWQSTKRFFRRVFPPFPDQPTFPEFLSRNGLNIATQMLCLLTSEMIYLFGKPLMVRRFPVYPGIERSAFGVKYGQPFHEEYINTPVSAVISFAVPFLAMGAVGLWKVKSFQDTNAAIMGLGYALSTATLFQGLIKWTIGGLRPHFLSVCSLPKNPPGTGSESHSIWYTAEICTNEDKKAVREAQMSFPSGHSVAAFAGFGFLALYMNAKFGIFASRPSPKNLDVGEDTEVGGNGTSSPAGPNRTSHWRLGLFVTPVLLAFIIAGSKVRDGWHHPADVIRGALIGSAFALMAYKMVYGSVRSKRGD